MVSDRKVFLNIPLIILLHILFFTSNEATADNVGIVKEFYLSNGIKVIHGLSPNNETAGVSLTVNVGLGHFSCEDQVTPHLIEHFLFEGTSKFSANQLRQRIREKAGRSNGFTFVDETMYVIDIHKDYTEFALKHLFHVLTESLFDEDAYRRAVRVVEIERGIYNNFFKKLIDNKRSVLEQTISRAYQGTPIECYKKSMPSDVSLEVIKEIRDLYYQPKNMSLIILSDIESNKLGTLLESTFGQYSVSAIEQLVKSVSLLPSEGNKDPVIEYTDPANIEADLFMIIPTVGYSHVDASIVELIGLYLDNELFKIVRNDLGLGYSPYAYYRYDTNHGNIIAYTKTVGRWVDEAEKVFLSVYNDLLLNGIAQEKLLHLIEQRKLELESEIKDTAGWLNHYRKVRFKKNKQSIIGELGSVDQKRIRQVLDDHFPQYPTFGMLRPRPAGNTSFHIILIVLFSFIFGLVIIFLKKVIVKKLNKKSF